MKTNIKSIVLKNCPYSNALIETFKKLNISSKFIKVTQDNKNKYKTDKINTFPQVYIDNYLIGGYDDTIFLIDIINNNTDMDLIKKQIIKKYPTINYKKLLRLILNLRYIK